MRLLILYFLIRVYFIYLQYLNIKVFNNKNQANKKMRHPLRGASILKRLRELLYIVFLAQSAL